MQINERLKAFVQLGTKIDSLTSDEIQQLTSKAQSKNGWFTQESIESALKGISYMLDPEKLAKWLGDYELSHDLPKIVGIVMAGNIPLVGFHDLLCILLSGHFAAIKTSSEDDVLIRAVVAWLVEIEPRFKKNLEFRDKLTQIDAVIATGSDNTARYFEYYFKDIPRLIRKNRTSIAILDGQETEDELTSLGNDIFSYFGLGCRNVSKVFTPQGYDIGKLLARFEQYESVIHHNKYRNNYDYYKSILLVNKVPHLDTGFLLVQSTDEIVSPISNLYHQEYTTKAELLGILDSLKDKIQCIVSHDEISFGNAQQPEVWDYADNVDTIQFLLELD